MIDPTLHQRNKAFDGLRGILACCVVLSHVAATVYNPFVAGAAPSVVNYSLWHLGAPSVDAFFVLSGWVVAQSYERYRHLWPFYQARLRRLYPIGLIGALLGLGLARPLASHLSSAALHHGFLVYLCAPLSSSDVVGALSLGLLAPYDANHLNPPLWSLAVEVWASVLMPLMVWAAKRWGWLSWPVSMMISLFTSFFWQGTLFMPLFLLGALLALNPFKVSKTAAPALLIFGLLVLFSRHISGSNDPFYRWLTQIGAGAALLSLSLTAPPFLSHRFVQWLGSRSYALYATHFPILVLFIFFFERPLGPQFAAALALPFTLVVADAVQRGVDWAQHPTRSFSFSGGRDVQSRPASSRSAFASRHRQGQETPLQTPFQSKVNK
ncbi:hypothetical protein Dxin01_00833 [Deinococcus xinjiangensis]|uniref:Acyltransferase 3 domain-containing protein n=1 Tax=Deinococcus xinjiangensis TaxID=457454 RepID=A0ABP9V767_9DEIO